MTMVSAALHAKHPSGNKGIASILLVIVGGLTPGCTGSSPPLERSCRGRVVPNCLPFEYSIANEAALEPNGLEVGNPLQEARIRVVLQSCGTDAPTPHRVAVLARAQNQAGFPDASTSSAVFSLIEVRDDGSTYGDSAEKDGLIDVTTPNPFADTEVPAERDIVLRFEPRAPPDCSSGTCRGGTCRGQPIEIPYRTGPQFTP